MWRVEEAEEVVEMKEEEGVEEGRGRCGGGWRSPNLGGQNHFLS